MARGVKTGGRQKGTPNRFTKATKNFFKAFIDETREEAFNCWRAIPDPGKRFDLWIKASEFAYPKLGRTEVVGNDGAPLNVVINVLKE